MPHDPNAQLTPEQFALQQQLTPEQLQHQAQQQAAQQAALEQLQQQAGEHAQVFAVVDNNNNVVANAIIQVQPDGSSSIQLQPIISEQF